MKVRNIVFSVVVTVVLLAPAMLYATATVGVKFPGEVTTEHAVYLSGGLEKADIIKELNLRGISSKRFQKETEKAIGNNIPFKAVAILTNASLQRCSIVASNFFFNFPCYPTYYSSERIRIDDNTVNYIPQTSNKNMTKKWTDFAEGLTEVARQNPDKSFIVYVVQAFNYPGQSPVYNLMSSPYRTLDCMKIMSGVEKECPNVKVLTQNYDSEEAYYSDFFRTDHHWNIRGALRAYNQISNVLKLTKVDIGEMREIPNYRFIGATARLGLDLSSESVFDCEYSFDELIAYRSNGDKISCGNHTDFYRANELYLPYAFHAEYYNNLGSYTVIEGGIGNKSALLIGNSYRAAVQRPLAYSYHKLTVINQLQPVTSLTVTLQEQINESNADDIIIVADPGNLKIDNKYWK